MKNNAYKIFEDNSKGFVSSLLISSNSYLFMLKQHFKSSSFYLGNLIIPMMITLSCIILFPVYYSFIWIMFISLAFTGFSTYGTLFFTIKKSTMMKNINLTLNESLSLYFATFFIILTSTLITLLVLLSTIAFFAVIGVASHEFFYNNGTPIGFRYWDWSEMWWEMIVYYWFMQAILSFSISFLIENMLTTQKNYFIVVFIYMLGGLFFSGIFTSTLYIEDDIVGVITSEVLDEWQSDESKAYMLQGVIFPYEFGEPLWFVSQLWPHYGLNQLAYNAFESGTYYIDEFEVKHLSEWNSVTFEKVLISPESLYYFLMPMAWSFICLWSGGFMNRYKKD